MVVLQIQQEEDATWKQTHKEIFIALQDVHAQELIAVAAPVHFLSLRPSNRNKKPDKQKIVYKSLII